VRNGPAHWATLSADAVLSAFGTSPAGLGATEAAARLQRYGPNQLPHAVRRPWYVELGVNFVHLFALLLWTGAVLAWIAGMPQLTWAIVVVILVNGVFSYWQEYQAERAAEALQALLPHQVRLRREGQEELVAAAEVVPGDILVLTEGEAVPADARVIAAEHLRIDNSSLTGESRPVPRTTHPVDATARAAAVLPNLVFAGTAVAAGRGEAVVFATGAATEFGRIAQLTQVQTDRPSPLQRELARVTRVVTLLAVGLGLFFFVSGTVLGGLSPAAAFLFAIGIIVANVPEGLLPTLTLALALGVRRMAARNALVKRLSAVETLGATTVILTDKTGTLTENEMTVREVWAAGVSYRVSGAGYDYDPTGTVEPIAPGVADTAAVSAVLQTAALCCDAHLLPPRANHQRWEAVGDPTEAAILVAAAKVGLSREALAAWPRLAELPFDSTRRRMTTIQGTDATPMACVKGAPSELFPRCARIRWNGSAVPFRDTYVQAAQGAHDALARRGLRVLAVATRTVAPDVHASDGWHVDAVEHDLTLLGLLAMEDPPRPEVPAALAACHDAGVRVVMVTGDNGLTAAAIAREIGLHRDSPLVISGTELDALDDQQLAAVLESRDVLFARASPEHKLRLVETYQRHGAVVAVTGDGVNDAPALKRADIGVAMGVTGTDVAREAADMVLLDDNFASIVSAVEEGRTVYANIRKFTGYIFTSNTPEALPFLAFGLSGGRIPIALDVMHILAIDLGTDLVPALALGAEAPEPGIMARPPRPRNEHLITRHLLFRSYLWLGIPQALVVMAMFYARFWTSGHGGAWLDLPDSGALYRSATAMALAAVVTTQIGNLFAHRTDRESVFRLGWGSNRLVWVGCASELAVILAIVYLPPLQAVIGTAALPLVAWVPLLAISPLLMLLDEARKAASRRAARSGGTP
jgi:magnesium-transporting ATPase (P-type)